MPVAPRPLIQFQYLSTRNNVQLTIDTMPIGQYRDPVTKVGMDMSYDQNSKSRSQQKNSNRRDFLRTGTAISTAAAVSLTATHQVHSQTKAKAGEPVRIGVIGCGGRGGGATNDNLTINENVRLVAMADLYPAKCERLRAGMAQRHGKKVAVEANKIHGGLEGYKKVLADKDVDLVLLTTSPGFRPYHISEAVAAGKHVFAEKPSCVDPAGYRVCVDAHEKAEANGTAIVTGTQYRRQPNYIEAIKKIHAGEIGDIVSATTRYCSSGIWYRPRKDGMSDTEYQLNNWMHFVWLSGDQITEQAVHNIDTINWVMQGPPESAYGSGGRFTRPEDSEMWDNISLDYRYPGNKILSFMCRQIPGTRGDNGNVIYGTEATAVIHAISRGSQIFDRDGKEIWSMKGDIGAAYRQEHRDLVDSIQAGTPIVELKETAASSLTAVMGRMAAYTGDLVSWDFVTKTSTLDLYPKDLAWEGGRPEWRHAVPGVDKLI